MKRLSIIVPMYNVAPYVGRCIISLEEQDIPKDEYEIICVNDGSPDNCMEIVEGLQQAYPNIILINQENQGVSRARNNGIDRATGKYLMFVDPDDYVDARSLSRILKTAEALGAQVSFLGFTVLNVDGTIRTRVINKQEKGKVVSGIAAYFLARGQGRTDPDRMWAVLFEREFMNLHKLRYLPDVPYLEDGELISRIMCLAERCMFDGHTFYRRTTRPGSATNSRLIYSDNAINGFVKAAVNLRNFRNQMLLSIPQKEFLSQPILKFVLLSITATASLRKFKTFLAVTIALKNNNLNTLDLNGCHKHYQNLGRLYNFTPYLLYSYLVMRTGVLFIWNLRLKGFNSKLDKGEII